MSANLHLLTPKSEREVWNGSEWGDNLESTEFVSEQLVEIPLLGKITAGLPIEGGRARNGFSSTKYGS